MRFVLKNGLILHDTAMAFRAAGAQLPRAFQPHLLSQHLRDLGVIRWRGDVRWKQFQLVAVAGVVEEPRSHNVQKLDRAAFLSDAGLVTLSEPLRDQRLVAQIAQHGVRNR